MLERTSGAVAESLHAYQTSPPGRALAPAIVPGSVGSWTSSSDSSVQSEELRPAGMFVHDQEGVAVGIPLGFHVAGEVDLKFATLTRPRPPDQRPAEIVPLVHDQEAIVAARGWPPVRMQAQSRSIRQVGDDVAVHVHDPQRRPARVARLGLVEAQELLVGGKAAEPALLAVLVNALGLGGAAQDVDGGAFVGRSAYDRHRLPDIQPGVVGTPERFSGDPALATFEWLDDPTAKLVAIGVVEPPDLVAVRGNDAGHGAFPAIRYLPMAIR